MRYGANHPADLVARAAEHGMTALALTDRDGLYGAVKFALACRSAGVRPIFGVDLADRPGAGHRAAPGARHPARRRGVAAPACGRRRPAASAGPRWGQRRPAAAPGHLPRPRRRRLAVAVPAHQRHPPARHPRGAGELAGDGRRARHRADRAARSRLRGGPRAGSPAGPTSPSPTSTPGGRRSGPAGWCSRSSTTAARATGPGRRRCSGSPPSRACRWC